jgi:hypothetical protein
MLIKLHSYARRPRKKYASNINELLFGKLDLANGKHPIEEIRLNFRSHSSSKVGVGETTKIGGKAINPTSVAKVHPIKVSDMAEPVTERTNQIT